MPALFILDSMATADQTHILDVDLELLRVTEGGLQRFDGEFLTSFVGEPHQELHNFIGRKL